MVAGLIGAILCTGRVSAGACLLPYSAIFCHILPSSAYYGDVRAMCGQYAAMCGNMPSAATRNILPYSARLLLYSTRVGLYRVGGMWWEQVVVRKVLRGGPVTIFIYT